MDRDRLPCGVGVLRVRPRLTGLHRRRGYNHQMRHPFIWLTVSATSFVALSIHVYAQRGGTAQAPMADLVLTNGRIVTVDDRRPLAEAIAVSGTRIEALGTADEIKRLVGPHTEVIDLKGQLAIPGFVESHAHFAGV